MWMTSNLPVPLKTWTRHGPASKGQWISVTLNPMIGILVANTWNSTMSTFLARLISLPTLFDSQSAAAAQSQHRTNDFWQHDPVKKTWTLDITSSHAISCSSLVMRRGEFAKSLHSERLTMIDKSVELRDPPILNMHLSDENSAIAEDDMTVDQKVQTLDFWTGRTIFRYGDNSGNPEQFALPSKNRPGPHHDKREAKNEKKSQRLKSIESVTDHTGDCTTKPVNLVRYDMSSFLESCVDVYCELAKVTKRTNCRTWQHRSQKLELPVQHWDVSSR